MRITTLLSLKRLKSFFVVVSSSKGELEGKPFKREMSEGVSSLLMTSCEQSGKGVMSYLMLKMLRGWNQRASKDLIEKIIFEVRSMFVNTLKAQCKIHC